MSAYRSSLFRSLKKEVSEKLPQGLNSQAGTERKASGLSACKGFQECV